MLRVFSVYYKESSLPQTSEECESILKSVILLIESPYSFHQVKAKAMLELLYEKKCKKALSWLWEKYRLNPSPSVQQFAKKAREYRKNLDH
jgi:hypothetical protein